MKRLFSILMLSTLIYSIQGVSAQEEMDNIKAEFEAMKRAQNSGFTEYKKSQEKAYNSYRNELNKFWDKPDLSTQKEWVSYSNDQKSRSKVDFEKGLLVIEVIASSEEDARAKLLDRIAYVVSQDTKEVVESDQLQKKLASLKPPKEIITSEIDAKPILSTVLFESKPTKEEVKIYAQNVLIRNNIEVSKSKFGHEKVYKVTVGLPADTTMKRSLVYKDEIIKNAARFEIPVPLVFAIMQTESNFNPFAKSHIPAFGLMQIVPRSAGKDVYRYLYKKKGMPSSTYLYNSSNNIEMGSTYIRILYYRYLKNIKNPESRLYCTIAAYNTGAGNIAWAFIRNNSMSEAAPKINAMTPDEVYNHLLNNLKYDEPKHYLKRVKRRMSAYKNAYKL